MRYADDWIIAIRGSKTEVISILDKIRRFLKEELELELNEDKTLIIHSSTGRALFLGTEIFRARRNTFCRDVKGKVIRNARRVRMEAPKWRIVKKLTEAGFVKNGRSVPRFLWLDFTLEQIVSLYNSVMWGISNYYSFVNNRAYIVTYVYYLLRGSCAMLIAAKLTLRSQLKVYVRFGKNLTISKKIQLLKPGCKVRP